MLGGDFRQETLSFVGPDTISNMQKYIFDKAFIGANGVSINEGLTTHNELEAIVDGEVVNRSQKIFLLVDDTKFNSIAFLRISEIDKIHYIITNKKLDRKFEEELQNRSIEIVYQ